MYVDALYRIAVQHWPQVYALQDKLVQQFGLNLRREAAWILKVGLGPSPMGRFGFVLNDGGTTERKIRW